ncbi:3'-5' exonuclease [Streptosporangium sp. NPDC002524]|uniref:3'-5' exonuclease n=1 Tax=Streptosporangium sp. NPDC002524 TaxID=3154537 RepID=UPI003331FE48
MTTEQAPAVARRRTTAHSATQLRLALGWTEDQLNRARAAALIPDPDLKTPRWSGPVVDDLVARRADLLEQLPDDLSDSQFMTLLGVGYGDWRRGRDAGLIPDPDRHPYPYWTRALAEEVAGRSQEIRQAIPPPPMGARRCAELLGELTGLEVTYDDITDLAKRGLVTAVGEYKGWALYDVAELRTVATDPERLAVLTEVIGARTAWLADSILPADAAAWLRWQEDDLARVADERDIELGRFGRYSRADIALLSGDEEFVEQVRRERLLGPNESAVHLEMRRTDFDYIVAAGWVEPSLYVTREVGRRSTVEVPLYAVGDLEDVLAEVPGVDWEAVRAAKPGEPSPLREHTRLPATRAAAIRAFCGDLGHTYSVEVWPSWRRLRQRWTVDWEQRADGHPTEEEVAAALAKHRGAGPYAEEIILSTAVGEVVRWARTCQQPGEAVILDTETTSLDGVIVEIAIVDAFDGRVLVNALVNPGGVPVEAGARAVHGITDAALAGAPSWEQVLPDVLAAVGTRRILAYNASFDEKAVRATHAHAGLDPAVLPAAGRWECLMEARSTWARVSRWFPLNGGHRALGDAQAAHKVLMSIGTPCS